MKHILNTSGIFILFTLFFACKSDLPVTSTGPIDKEKYYNWSVNTFVLTNSLYHFSAGDDKTIFLIVGFRGHRYSNGILTRLYFNDSSFTTGRVNALNGDYAVFGGGNAVLSTFKIYDSGSYQTFTKDSVNYISTIFIEAKNKIYFSEANGNRYFLYLNGNVTEHTLPAPGRAFLYGRINEKVCVLGYDATSIVSIYYLSNGNASVVYSESGVNQHYFFVNNTLLKSEQFGNQRRFYYFNGTGFTPLFTTPSKALYDAAGVSSDNLTNFCVDSTNVYNTYVWNGSENIKQKNFPLNPIYSQSGSNNLYVSESKNKSFFVLCNNFDTLKIVSGSYAY